MKLVLENGQEFHGLGYGSQSPVVGEIVFNTSMVGYQEIASDPAYAGQLVVMTYPLIGQYGITDDDFEARTFSIGGLIVREYCDTPSNFRYTKTLSEEMDEHGIPILSGPDTRMLTRIIRTEGSMKAAIVDESMSTGNALVLIAQAPVQTDQVAKVSCTKRWFSRTPQHKYDVVIVDCGLKHSIVSALNQRGCNVTVVPYNSTLEEILYARPRTKEFLIAFPAVMLFVYSMVRNQKICAFIFGLAGVIGFTSVINTFMHIRTPMELGFSRTAYSVVFGVVLGVLYVVVFDVICRLFRKWGARYNA